MAKYIYFKLSIHLIGYHMHTSHIVEKTLQNNFSTPKDFSTFSFAQR